MIVSEMLPELLFSVGGGMQDFSKDDLGLLGSGVVSSEKDLLGHSHQQQTHDHHAIGGSHQLHLHPAGAGGSVAGLVAGIGVDDIKLTHIPDLLEVPGDASKLEEPERDLYPWLSSAGNIGSRFLRSSDDPLISGGTNDNPHEDELSVPTVSQSMCPSPTTPPPKHRHPSVALSPELREPTLLSPLPTPPKASAQVNLNENGNHQAQQKEQQPRPRRASGAGPPRVRRKGPIKLRFHHQALPQEYLDHYEATQNNLQRKETAQQQQSKQARQQQQSKQQPSSQQSRKAMMAERQAAQEREERANESVRSWLQKILELQKEGVSLAPLRDDVVQPPTVADSSTGQNCTTQKRIVSYTDLPYMGEITLDNSKPRRGRKPKKADICHLIYKNYGTILPGTPSREPMSEKPVAGVGAKGCSRSVASLLERRLTASDEKKPKPTNQPAKPTPRKEEETSDPTGRRKGEEPLNLCVRDSSAGGGTESALSLSSSDEDVDPDDTGFASSCPTPIITPSDISTDQALAANMKLSLPTLQSSSGSTTETPSTAETPPGCMYWSSSATPLFVHPMSMYYPGTVTPSGEEVAGRAPDAQSHYRSTRAGAPSTASSPPTSPVDVKGESLHQPMLVPKHISQLMKHEKHPTTTTMTNRVASQRSPPAQKRKRSAIFIPPVPAENSSNPATEVSICKFKFTGGAKPCLQEKKILSVDSGGNFRYYSGTGDKSMRGYEFFPRESLQQSSINATSTTGAFLNASGERISCDLPPPSLGLSNDLLQIPDFPTSPQPSPLPSPTAAGRGLLQPPGAASERRRRKSRRATQRESLEKTFKEKGFLIQTQQLQSAEGATYCKFRQLRKFTRYLFRSWKDYLPGELQQQQQQQPSPTHTQLLEGDLPSMTQPPGTSVVTSTRETPPDVGDSFDEGSLLAASSGGSGVRMETVDIRRSSTDCAIGSLVTMHHHRLRRSRRTSSTASSSSQHGHSETLVIDTAYHRQRAGSLSPVAVD